MLIQVLELPDEHTANVYNFEQQEARTWFVLKKELEPDEEAMFQEYKDRKEIPVKLFPAKMSSKNRDAQIVGCCLAFGAKMALGLENEPIDAIRIFIKGPVNAPCVGVAFRRKASDGDNKTSTDTTSSKKS